MRLRRIFILTFTALFILSGLSVATAADIRTIDVASVSWLGAPAFSATTGEIESAIRTEVGPRWLRYTTIEGAKEDKSINFVHGQTLSSPVILSRAMQCEGSSSTSFMTAIRGEVYKRLGIEDFSKRYLVVLTPYAGCIWSGRALIGDIDTGGGVITMHDTSSAYIIVHELGHSLGLGHSNFLRCDSGKNDGPWGSDCKAVEYGGTIDVMGNVDVDAPLSTYNQWLTGYLDKSEIKQSWVSEKIELNASDVAGGTRAIFLRDDKATYWVEYRRALPGANYKPGLAIFRTDPPPRNIVVSPNPEDSLGANPGDGVSTDYYMLNWDNYTYVRSRAAGSMTLPQGSVATTFSGAISISATGTDSDKKVIVNITRKADTTPPPTPEIIDSALWRNPNFSILKSGYDDGESAIAGFEIDVNGKVSAVDSGEVEGFAPSYLNPISPQKTVYVRNLPEGDYTIALRAIDVWGNKSPWSKSMKAYIDRGNPIVTKDFKVDSVSATSTNLVWNGVRDEGIGLCSTILHNEEGFVLARSSAKSSPSFSIPTGDAFAAKVQVFDCLGNGMAGDVSFNSVLIDTKRGSRTGKWSAAPAVYGPGALKCSGKCTVSVSVNGNVSVRIGEGSADVSLAGKVVAKVPAASAQVIRNSDSIAIGDRGKVIRVTGTNFVYAGVSRLEAKVGEFKAIALGPEFPDPSLDEPIQKSMSRFGFSASDFTNDWTVLPMARGTTLLDPTLDLCGADYVSESGREVRRQISVSKVGSPYQFLSSESVKYRSVAAANAALAELKRNFEACVDNKGGNENGVFTSYSFQTIPDTKASLVDEASRVIVRATIGTGSAARQLFGAYQFNGQYFTGLYVVIGGEKAISDAEVKRWLDVAGVMAQRLKANSSTSA